MRDAPNEHTDDHDDIAPGAADAAVLVRVASSFEAEVIAEAVRARGVEAWVVASPPDILPLSGAGPAHNAMVLVRRIDAERADDALNDARSTDQRDFDAHADDAEQHVEPRLNADATTGPDADRLDELAWERVSRRRRGRLGRYAVRLIALCAIAAVGAWNPLAAGALLILLLLVEVALLGRVIAQANAHADTPHDPR